MLDAPLRVGWRVCVMTLVAVPEAPPRRHGVGREAQVAIKVAAEGAILHVCAGGSAAVILPGV